MKATCPPQPPVQRWSCGFAALTALLLSTSFAQGQPAAPRAPDTDPGARPHNPNSPSTPDNEAPEHPEPARSTPPSVKQIPDVGYPDGVDTPRDVEVELELLIDDTGTVAEASVVTGAGAPFDAFALESITKFSFSPALHEGAPVSARIRYRLVLHAPLPPTPAPEEPQTPAPATPLTPTPPPPQPTAPAETHDIIEEEYEATAEIEAPPREVTRRTLKKKQLTTMPGTRGDALRAVEVLPGVGRTEFGGNDGPPVIRGAVPYESVVLLDGAPTPTLYHFGGLTSFYNSQLLESVDYYPGNFSARYGRATAGIVQARTRDPRSDRFGGMLELSLIDSFVMLEGPVADQTSVAAAARRSNIDLVFEKAVPEDAYNVAVAPVYYDYQAMLTHRFDHHRLKLQAYGSYDRLELFFANPANDDPVFRDKVGAETSFHRLQLGLTSKWSKYVEQNIELSAGPSSASQNFGPLTARFDGIDGFGRAEWAVFAHPSLRIDVGLDALFYTFDGYYEGPAPPQEEGNPNEDQPLGTYEKISIEDTLTGFRPGAYLELSYRPVSNWLLVPGVRADYDKDTQHFSVDPRFSTRFDLTNSTTLKGGLGHYSQHAEYYQVLEPIGNPKLEPHHAVHTSLGIEQSFGSVLEVGLEGFYKYLYNRVVGTPGGVSPAFVNDGTGRIYGAELSLKLHTESQFAYLAYTLSRSERRDYDQPWRLFDRDQPHVLSAVYNYDFGSGWSAGARFRLVSGDPETPVTGNVYDANTDLYYALYGAPNSARAPFFHQLDLRGEKKWSFNSFSLTAYLELLNAYNAENVEGYDYSYDYSKKETATGLPFFPNLGLRGEL